MINTRILAFHLHKFSIPIAKVRACTAGFNKYWNGSVVIWGKFRHWLNRITTSGAANHKKSSKLHFRFRKFLCSEWPKFSFSECSLLLTWFTFCSKGNGCHHKGILCSYKCHYFYLKGSSVLFVSLGKVSLTALGTKIPVLRNLVVVLF